VKSLRVRLAEEWGVTRNAVSGMVGVLARGGKVLTDLSNMGYVVPELAAWVGAPLPEVLGGAQGGGQVPQEVLSGGEVVADLPGGGPQRLPISQKPVTIGQVIPGQTSTLATNQPTNQPAYQPAYQAGQQPGEQTPRGPFQGPSAALTAEEVALLAGNQVTYQNGRWLHTELTPSGYRSTFVDPRVELNKINGENEGASVMTSVGGQMLNTLTIQTGLL